jgi:hypothetical protein
VVSRDNPDVAAKRGDPLAHYLDYGWGEGRRPNPLFDPAWYLERYPDVAEAGKEPLGHYAESGWREGRLPSPNFDAVAYLASNPDIAAQGMNPLEHYLRYGRDEKRPIHRVEDGPASEEVRNRFPERRPVAHDGSPKATDEDALRRVLAMTQAVVQDKLAETGVRLQVGSPSQLDGSGAEIEERIRRLLLILSLEASAPRPVQQAAA